MGIGMANNDNQVQQGIATRPGTSSIKPTQLLHDLGQSLWLDNITRDPAPDHNASCGPAPAPRIPKPLIPSTSRRWPPRSR